MPEQLNEYLSGLIGSAGLPSSGYQILIVVFAFLAVLVVAFSLGKSRTLLALISLYIAAFISSRFGFLEELQEIVGLGQSSDKLFIVRLVLFVIIFSGVIFILSRSFLRHKLTIRESSIFAVILTALLSVGFLISVFTSYIPQGESELVPPLIMLLFGSKAAQLIWAVLPVAGMVLLKREGR